MRLPSRYDWLYSEPGPRLIVEALKTVGVAEVPGQRHSPEIIRWAAATQLENVYTADEIPWCGLWMAYVCLMAQKPSVDGPLWALNWSKWGVDGGQPELGDILTFIRPGGGHVGIYVGEDVRGYYHVLGGNTANAVGVARIEKKRLRACRQFFAVGKPANVRPIILRPEGDISTNEA